MSESPGATRAWRVLIADDESLIRLDLREMLTELGYDVIGEAGDGRAALDLSRKLQPDIVIMDIKMPELDGIAVAEELTREKIAPVVLLTAYSDQPLVERAREAGVVGYGCFLGIGKIARISKWINATELETTGNEV